MKKIIIGLLLLGLTIPLLSCSSKENIYKNKGIKNYLELEYQSEINREVPVKKIELNSKSEVYEEEKGSFLKTSDEEYYYFYSLLLDNPFLFKILKSDFLSFKTEEKAIDYLIVTYRDDCSIVADSYGNILLPKGTHIDLSITATYQDSNSQTLFQTSFQETICYTDERENIVSSTKTVQIIGNQENYESSLIRSDSTDVQQYIASLNKCVDLSIAGLPGYVLFSTTNNSHRVIETKTGKIVSEYILKKNSRSLFGKGYFLYQEDIELPEDEKNYDLLLGGNTKYRLETHILNLLTGEDKTIRFPYVINDTEPICEVKKTGNNLELYYDYFMAEVYPIENQQLSSNTISLIIDAKGNILDKAPTYLSILKIGEKNYLGETIDGYYLLDSSFNMITFLGESEGDFEILYGAKAISVWNESLQKFGFIDMNGKIIEGFIYDDVKILDEGFVYGICNEVNYLLHFQEGTMIGNAETEAKILSNYSLLKAGIWIVNGKIILEVSLDTNGSLKAYDLNHNLLYSLEGNQFILSKTYLSGPNSLLEIKYYDTIGTHIVLLKMIEGSKK